MAPPTGTDLKNNDEILRDMVESTGLSYEDNFQQRWYQRLAGVPISIYKEGTFIPDRKEIAYQATLNYYLQITEDDEVTQEELDGLRESIEFTKQIE